ncbi:poly-gamma-glutamate hydrolase family protein [Streptomyces sp. NPDC088354]|uniref:poly-gamma-glutamate hydrolase family protein n=1 Tax=unclassified Streptomyces TaxID=2593676 RepID=UPI0029BC24A9|nr:poly-gamma-glutamate hydrolase family protein [Streptomyces sp. MI02-7b]MDX3073168.1 poly-gamma-glutamate hydrolase family protein [Streptomyces sp. MI02-7b]
MTTHTGYASASFDTYASNTALYADTALTEGTDWARRFRRHAAGDPAARPGDTVVVAPHAGGIEAGTSELCLAVAGYHPADLAPTPPGGPVYDYWMFEGLRVTGNAALHVTSTRCDDPVARAMAAGSLRVLSLHGCTARQAGLPEGAGAVLVGGADTAFAGQLTAALTDAGLHAVDASEVGELAGRSPANICNGTRRGRGAQLEITAPLRTAMFGTHTRAGRGGTTRPVFWSLVAAVRAAIAAAS